MNPLLNAIEELRQKEVVASNIFGISKPTGMVNIEDAIEILQNLEVSIRTECECEEIKQEKLYEV